MAKIKTDAKEIEIPDNSPIADACEQLGVMFSCRVGVCGICKIEIIEGMENLNPKTNEENDMGLADNERLACQCKIKTGTVKIKF